MHKYLWMYICISVYIYEDRHAQAYACMYV